MNLLFTCSEQSLQNGSNLCCLRYKNTDLPRLGRAWNRSPDGNVRHLIAFREVQLLLENPQQESCPTNQGAENSITHLLELKNKSGVDKIIVKKQPYQLLNTNREFFPSFYTNFHKLFDQFP